jgi:hypothetical protein
MLLFSFRRPHFLLKNAMPSCSQTFMALFKVMVLGDVINLQLSATSLEAGTVSRNHTTSTFDQQNQI